MDKNVKENRRHHYLLVLFGVILLIVLQHLSTLFNFVDDFFGIFKPLVWGFVLAFIFNVPMRAIERFIDKIRYRKRKKEKEVKPMNLKIKRAISFASTVLLLLIVLLVIGSVVAPKMAESIVSIYDLIVSKLPDIMKLLEEHDIDAKFITDWINNLDIKKVVEFLSQKDFDVIDFLFSFVGSTVSSIVSIGVAIVITIYALLGKESLCNSTKRLITVHVKEKYAKFILHVADLINDRYTKFLSGQAIESCILGLLMFIVLSIFKIPYASLIGVLTALCAFIPYIGAFLSCFIGAFLVLLVKPELIIIYIVAYLLTQFIENQFIYPHVVGNSVGLKAIWTIIAVFIGGKLFGVLGMIFFIPLVAVIVTLVNEYTTKKEKNKNSLE